MAEEDPCDNWSCVYKREVTSISPCCDDLVINTDGDPELLCDSDFYQQLLKEFFETIDLESSDPSRLLEAANPLHSNIFLMIRTNIFDGHREAWCCAWYMIQESCYLSLCLHVFPLCNKTSCYAYTSSPCLCNKTRCWYNLARCG